ncbi:MAG: carboxylate/amino acid/amine transporter [Gammaproteobacteria bacterium]|nr:carboxylate/amino acid/amine transporter [Gammaproteobacteria bacterium]MBU1468594.1 carboxylate/amino acid/amine transporter [Gammaproteobacteria bacterium]MBU2022369.1 carboxylate/amino acid/amine transporter [Gammaproteobacteria bacterium]MBU2238508.1 carboxylate/amino acid/amine transporter [Gammaproteobacteria bacterium]MBU2320956.1 carboxylate/amino acid/amine transporter [Gammaproteobacteria bacterium]
MPILIAVTLLWAFSFSLIGVYLAGQVDAWFSVLMRVTLATVVFLPFLKLRQIEANIAFKLMICGALQLGIMYGFYYQSFLYLSVPEVLLFTVMTPLYVTLINDMLDRRLNIGFAISAILAILGAVAIRYQGIDEGFIKGLLIVQGANICFASGQVGYKRIIAKERPDLPQRTVFGWFFLGALAVVIPCYLALGNPDKLPTTTLQWSILTYLGIVASGLGYFAWNKGATMVDIGTLAVANNLLIPAGIVVNVIFWNRDADILRLAIGGGIILLALWVNDKFNQKHATAQTDA